MSFLDVVSTAELELASLFVTCVVSDLDELSSMMFEGACSFVPGAAGSLTLVSDSCCAVLLSVSASSASLALLLLLIFSVDSDSSALDTLDCVSWLCKATSFLPEGLLSIEFTWLVVGSFGTSAA